MSTVALVGTRRPWPAMPRRSLLRGTLIAAARVLTACATESEFLAENASAAFRTADNRGRFELDCPKVQTTVLSQKATQSIQGYGWRGAGMRLVLGPNTRSAFAAVGRKPCT